MKDKLGMGYIFATVVIVGLLGMLLGVEVGLLASIATATMFIIEEIRDAQGYYDKSEKESEEAEKGDKNRAEEL